MNNSIIQLLVLAGVAIFLIVKLRSVLGTREGFEKPQVPPPSRRGDPRDNLSVVEGGPDADISDYVPDGSPAARAFAAMKEAEPGFSVRDFLQGARGAYEMILLAFERGDISGVRNFLSRDVADSFDQVIAARAAQNLKVEANFAGLRDIGIVNAEYNRETQEAEVTLRFVGELTSVVRNAAGEVIEGNANTPRRQKDIWTFARFMRADDPNWELVATGE